MDDAAVQLCVEVDDSKINEDHCDEHMFNEGFVFRQAVRLVLFGDVIDADT